MDYMLLYNKRGEVLNKDCYNKYFNPNVCQVCKIPDDDLIPCNACGLIYYCSGYHRMLDQELHSQLCAALITATKLFDPGLNKCFKLEDWKKLRTNIITSVKQNIQRDLKPFEIDIIMYAKSCFYCHKRTNLRTCDICYSTNYCANHDVVFLEQHNTCQNDLLILSCINLYSTYNVASEPYPTHIKFTLFPSQKCYSDMAIFVNEYIVQYKTKIHIKNWHPRHYIYTDYMSNPLTLYYACEELNVSHIIRNADKYVIHILAAYIVDVIGIAAWELFIHLFSNIKEIYVVMIKSEQNFNYSYEYEDVCSNCRGNYQCKFYFENVTVPYYDYVNTPSYKQPDAIIGSLPRLITTGVWSESFRVILSQKCPVFLTGRSINQMIEMTNILNSITVSINTIIRENKYPGLRPYRDCETDKILYHNQYILTFSEFELLTKCD